MKNNSLKMIIRNDLQGMGKPTRNGKRDLLARKVKF